MGLNRNVLIKVDLDSEEKEYFSSGTKKKYSTDLEREEIQTGVDDNDWWSFLSYEAKRNGLKMRSYPKNRRDILVKGFIEMIEEQISDPFYIKSFIRVLFQDWGFLTNKHNLSGFLEETISLEFLTTIEVFEMLMGDLFHLVIDLPKNEQDRG